MKPRAPGAVLCLSFLTRTEHRVIWKLVISLGAAASLWSTELSSAFQPQKCTHWNMVATQAWRTQDRMAGEASGSPGGWHSISKLGGSPQRPQGTKEGWADEPQAAAWDPSPPGPCDTSDTFTEKPHECRCSPSAPSAISQHWVPSAALPGPTTSRSLEFGGLAAPPPPDPLSPDLPHPVPCSNQATGLWPLLGLGHRKVLEWTAGKEVGVSAPPGGGATATKGAPMPCWPLLFVAPSLRPLIPFGGRWSVSSLKPCLQVSCC